MWWVILVAVALALVVGLLAEMSVDAQQALFKRDSEGKYMRGQRIVQLFVLIVVLVILAWAAWYCYTELRKGPRDIWRAEFRNSDTVMAQ